MQQFMHLNLLGEKVAELVNGELTAGYRHIEFNRQDFQAEFTFTNFKLARLGIQKR